MNLKIILLDHQNNYVGRVLWWLEYHHFLQHCSLCLSFIHNYFEGSTKLFSDLYLPKFLEKFYFNKVILSTV